MKLEKIIANTEVLEIVGNKDIEVKDLSTDSNSVTAGSLFICLNGKDYDGHSFISQVERYGAVAVICEKRLETSLTQIIVRNSRKAMSIAAANFFGNPDRKMKLIGVTGTNGKTTTTHLITSILMRAGVKCGLIGTLGTFYADTYLEPSLTTPDPIVLHKTLADMYEKGVETVIMEISAHAVYLDKVSGLRFEIAVFTNLSHDHLDFFGTMENYKRAKLKFFRENECKYVVTNSDDATGREISGIIKQALSYGIDNPADVFAIKIKEKTYGTDFVLNLFDCIYNIKLSLIGRFNVYNALAAATVSALYGIPTEKVAEGLEDLKGVSGRLESVYSGDYTVYIDYAHTPDGLEKTLTALRPVCCGRLICVFGCGGNRDEKKRRVMGAISGKLADFTVITTDNPRFEDPMDIIWEIEKGVLEKSRNYVIVQDRAEAIKYALSSAAKGDVVLVAGKGSEKYQDIFGIKHLYNDKDTIEEILRGKNK